MKRAETDAAGAEAPPKAAMQPDDMVRRVTNRSPAGRAHAEKMQDLLVRQRSMLINALRGQLGELGIVSAQEAAGVITAITALRLEADQQRWPDCLSTA